MYHIPLLFFALSHQKKTQITCTQQFGIVGHGGDTFGYLAISLFRESSLRGVSLL